MAVAVDQARETGGTLSFPLHSWDTIDPIDTAGTPTVRRLSRVFCLELRKLP